MKSAEIQQQEREKIVKSFIELLATKDANLKTLELASIAVDIDPEYSYILFPSGLTSVARFVIDESLAKLEQDLIKNPKQLTKLRTNQKIKYIVKAHLMLLTEYRLSFAKLFNITKPDLWCGGSKMLWRIADTIWHLAGDQATDENHYSKRAILAKVYLVTLSQFLTDESPEFRETWKRLDREVLHAMKLGQIMALPSKIAKKIPIIRLFFT